MHKDIDTFLREKGMHYDTIDMMAEMTAFRRQMEDGLAGKPSSLLMLPAFITVDNALSSGEEVIVMDAGGTNLRVATVHMEQGGKLFVSGFNKMPIPGTRGRITVNEFFEAIANALQPVLHVSDKIGFCFSFPCEILPNKDGRILGFNKEVQVDRAAGQVIGDSVNAVLRARGQAEKRFVILNDTVATMLGGIAAGAAKNYDSYIGYILGTGTNTCYLESCSNIAKSSETGKMGGYMAVNMESGGYDGYVQGVYDKELDDASNNPGDHKMEKMISGAYQGMSIYKTVQGAVDKGLFSPKFAARFLGIESFSLRQIDDFCAAPYGEGDLAKLVEGCAEDGGRLMDVIDASVERAARITSINFGAIITHIGAGSDPERPVCVMAEGTSFKKSVLFGGKLNAYIKDFLNDRLGVYCDIISEDDVTLTGTAVAAMMLRE